MVSPEGPTSGCQAMEAFELKKETFKAWLSLRTQTADRYLVSRRTVASVVVDAKTQV